MAQGISLVSSLGAATFATDVVSGFMSVPATQMPWGLSRNFASGADMAWISDELDEPTAVAVVLIRAEQAQLARTVAGLVSVSQMSARIHRGSSPDLLATASCRYAATSSRFIGS